jgi:hypothetical protein
MNAMKEKYEAHIERIKIGQKAPIKPKCNAKRFRGWEILQLNIEKVRKNLKVRVVYT